MIFQGTKRIRARVRRARFHEVHQASSEALQRLTARYDRTWASYLQVARWVSRPDPHPVASPRRWVLVAMAPPVSSAGSIRRFVPPVGPPAASQDRPWPLRGE
jgi:hypothetical protein